METTKEHWEKIYATKKPTEFSWFQSYPKTSIEFIEATRVDKDAAIIDIGGGDSLLVDALLEKGYSNLYVLDISGAAIERAKIRLKEKANLVHWIISDVTEFKPAVEFDVWHDRAAFHFLTRAEQVKTYLSIAEKSIKEGGFLTIGTFLEQGPEKCSGLPIRQYSEDALTHLLESSFTKINCIEEDHITPFQTHQVFLFCRFLHRAA